jgi:hypothetical protein
MSAFGGKADIVIAKCPRPKSGFVRYCPKADIVSAFCGDPGAASLIGAAIFDNGTRLGAISEWYNRNRWK